MAVFIMLNLQGNPKDRPSAKMLRWLHRIFGYLFLMIYLINLILMAKRLIGMPVEPSPRLILHITLALLLIPVFLVKISISRFFKKLYSFLIPLGLIIFFASFVMIAITAGYYLITSAELPDLSKTDAKKILEQKCTICHNLDRVRKADKTEAQWTATIERMIKYTRNPDHLSQPEITSLIEHLTQQNRP
jgi:hypothetical protein